MVARVGANLVPMATPYRCLYVSPLKLNTLFLSTYDKMSKNTSMGERWERLYISNTLLTASSASSCDILVYRLATSNVTSILSLGILVVSMVLINCVELTTKDFPSRVMGWRKLSM